MRREHLAIPLLSGLLAAAAAPAAGAAGLADLLPPGHRSVVHEIVVLADPALEDLQLVAAPYPGFAGVVPVEPGVPFRFSSKYGTRLYGLPRGAEVPDRFAPESFPPECVLMGPFAEVASAPALSPLARVLTTYRVEGSEGGKPRFVLAGETRFGPGGVELSLSALLPWLLGLAAIGVAGLLLVARWRRRGTTRSGSATA